MVRLGQAALTPRMGRDMPRDSQFSQWKIWFEHNSDCWMAWESASCMQVLELVWVECNRLQQVFCSQNEWVESPVFLAVLEVIHTALQCDIHNGRF